jgi:hypothetical protein
MGAEVSTLSSRMSRPVIRPWRAIGEPAWSADGRKLLVVTADDKHHRERVALLQRFGDELRRDREADLPWGAGDVRFSDSPGSLVFHVRRGNTYDIWTCDLATGLSRRLIPNGLQPTTIPSGGILFLRPESDGLNLYLWQRAPGRSVKLTKDAHVRDLVVSPQGTSVAVLYTQQATAEEINPQQVLVALSLEGKHAATRIGLAPHLDYGLAWSDDHTVVFGRVRRVSGPQLFEFAVFEYDLRTHSETARLPYGEVPPIAGRGWWSTDSMYVVYPATEPGPDGFLRLDPRVFLRVDTRTGKLTRMRFPFNVKTASISPDGELLIGVGEGEGPQLAVGEWASGRIRRIAEPRSGCQQGQLSVRRTQDLSQGKKCS